MMEKRDPRYAESAWNDIHPIRVNRVLAGRDEGDGGGRAEGGPAMAECAGSSVEKSDQELLPAIIGECEAEEIGVARV